MIYKIYGHRSPPNKWYIGRTEQTLEGRWNKGKGYTKDQPKIFRAIKKYGWDNFEHILIAETDTTQSALIIEEMFKRWYDAVDNGYCCVYSENEAPAKNPEVAKKIGATQRGVPKSEETKRNMSAALKGKPSHWKGKKRGVMPLEQREKISKTSTESWKTSKRRHTPKDEEIDDNKEETH